MKATIATTTPSRVRCTDLFGGFGRECNPKDVIMTPDKVARQIVNHFKPSGRILDPCRGNGAFWNAMPGAEWCEIAEGRDFFAWRDPVDWIVSNPPYSIFYEWMRHSFDVADEIVYLIPLHKLFAGAKYLDLVLGFGGIVEIISLGSGRACGWQIGFSIGAVHFRRGYKGETRIGYPPNVRMSDRP